MELMTGLSKMPLPALVKLRRVREVKQILVLLTEDDILCYSE